MQQSILDGFACGPGRTALAASESTDQYLAISDGNARLRRKGEDIIVPAIGAGNLYCIASGVPTLPYPKLSADIAIRAILGFYENTNNAEVKLQLGNFVLDAHRKLRTRAKDQGLSPLGTSLGICWVNGNRFHFANIGDTRIYQMRGGELQCLTKDHSRREFASRGDLPEPEKPDRLAQAFLFGQSYPERNTSLQLDLGLDVNSMRTQSGDRFLIASRGLYKHVKAEQMTKALHGNLEHAANYLYQKAYQHEGEEEICAVVIGID
jgi:PPM family protein phosphatase